jgi:hypothetical protein
VSRIIPLKDFGIPVPTTAPPATDHLIVYYGPKGFIPAYMQSARIDAGPISGLTVKTVNSVQYWDDPIATELPGGLGNGTYDFVFTLMDTNGNEGDFSLPISAIIDTVVPPTLGQAIALT